MAMRIERRAALAFALACFVGAGPAWAKGEQDGTAGAAALSSAIVPAVANPRRIAQGPEGQILVTDRRYGAVVAIDKQSLEPVWSAAWPDGGPFGVAFARKDVIVGNTVTKNVESYRLRGTGGLDTVLEFDFNFGDVPEGATGAIGNPIDVAFDGNEKLAFVLDGAAKSIGIYDKKGALLRSFEPRGSDGLLLSPVSLDIDELRRELLVADYGDPAPDGEPARIMIFSYEGALLDEISGDSTYSFLPPRFLRLQGLAAGADGRIFAADPLGGRILVFDRVSGAILDRLGVKGEAPGQLMAPSDVWLDPATGDLFISNNLGARRVEVLRGAGGQP